MTKNEKRLFCVNNHDNHKCFINNNKCKKACRKMILDTESVNEGLKLKTGIDEIDELMKGNILSKDFMSFSGKETK